jgi:hypothetical protein
MAINLRARIRLYKLRWITWQVNLAHRIIKDASPGDEEVHKTIEDMEAAKLTLERRWLFTVIGQALSSWALIEENLVAIAAMLLRIERQEAGLILYSIINFNTWLSIIEELFKMKDEYTELISEWHKISDRLRGLKTTRDNLAHQTVYYGGRDKDVALRPAPFDVRTQSQRHKPLGIEEIFKYSEDLTPVQATLTRLIEIMAPIYAATLLKKSSL